MAAWMAHLCGLCLTLRDRHGQLARAATNVDGMMLSVLVAAQSAGGGRRRTAGPCPLRGMRRAQVVASDEQGTRLAAAVSLAAAATKAADHVADGDGLLARRPVGAAAGLLARRAAAAGHRTGAAVGFDVAVLERAADTQRMLERRHAPGRPDRPADPVAALLELLAPTEGAVGAAVAHTAVLAGRPANREPLARVGRMFGRIVHLLDAVTDQRRDAAAGAWNPLTATGVGPAEARRLCDEARRDLGAALGEVAFTDNIDARLARVLLGRELDRAVDRAFQAVGLAAWPPSGAHPHHGSSHHAHQHGGRPARRGRCARLREEIRRDPTSCCDCCECGDCCGSCRGRGGGGGRGGGDCDCCGCDC